MKRLVVLGMMAMLFVAPMEMKAQSVEQSNDEKVEVVTYEMAQYPGGYEQLAADANRSICYPSMAYERGIEEDLMVRFVVEADGTVSNIQNIDADDVFYKAVVTFLKNTLWIPATANGKYIRSTVTLPLSFKL